MQAADNHNPAEVAANMVAIRGREEALSRLDRYISREIRSENSIEFWKAVKIEAEKL